jgi:O-antigen/teichoic acid export membrane protein
MLSSLQPLLKRILASRVLRDSGVIFIGRWVNLALSILTSALVARALGLEQTGLVTLAMASVSIVVQFIDVRTSEALIRFMGNALAREERDEALSYFHIGLLVDVVVAALALVIVLLIVPSLLNGYADRDRLLPLFSIYVLTTPFTILQNTFEAAFTIYRRFRLQTLLDIGMAVLSLVVLVVLSASGMEAVMWGYVGVAVVNLSVTGGVSVWLLRRGLGGAAGGGYRERLRQFMPFALHTSLMGSIKAAAVHFDALLLGGLRGPTDVALFDKARSALSLLSLPVSPVSSVVYPMMNDAWAKGDQKRLRYLIRRFMLFSLVVGLAGAGVFFVAADWLVVLIYGTEFAAAAGLLRIMLIGILLELVMGWVRTVAMVAGRPQLVTYTGLTAIIGRYVAAVPLIGALGAAGAAIGYNLGAGLSVLLNAVFVLPRLHIWQQNPNRQTAKDAEKPDLTAKAPGSPKAFSGKSDS